jgi:arylsulfatase A-like enzyme
VRAAHQGSSRHRWRAATAAVIALAGVAATGCRREPTSEGRLLDRLETAASGSAACDAGEAQAGPAATRPLTVGHSLRPARLTCAGGSLRITVDLPRQPSLQLAVAPLAGEPAGEASVEVRREGEAPRSFRLPLVPGRWTEQRLDLEDAGPVEIVLRAEGGAAAAWADLFLASSARRGSAARPTSLVLVSLDTVRADHMSVYGYGRQTTPRLESFAAGSLVFDRALSSSTWTLPSTATMLTGLLPAQHGANRRTRSLGSEVVTVAERLAAAGYRTAAITEGGFVGPSWGLAQGFDRYDVQPGLAWQADTRDVARTVAAAETWVRENRNRPFFLFLHTYEAHQPYVDREGFAQPFLAAADRGAAGLSRRVDPRAAPPSTEELARLVALYDGEIARTDHYLSRFLAVLQEMVGDDVAVVVTSDHGEEFLEHGDLEHGFGKVFDPNVRVPLIVRPPAARRGLAGRFSMPVSGLDVVPTLLDLAGLPHDDLPGRSLLAIAGGPRGEQERKQQPTSTERFVLVHGLPSMPRGGEERFRVDGTAGSVVLERRDGRRRLQDYDRGSLEVRPLARGRRPAELLRLATLVSWAQPGGLLARLPDDAVHLAVPEGSAVRPRALWSGTTWRLFDGAAAGAVAPGGAGAPLSPGGPHLISFELEAGGAAGPADGPGDKRWALLLKRSPGAAGSPARSADEGASSHAEVAGVASRLGLYMLVPERQTGWDPFSGALPEPARVLRGGAVAAAATARVDATTAAELEALGYVQ